MNGRGLHIYALCYLLFLYAPILLLPIFAFNDGTVIAFPLKGFTTQWFVQAFENATLRRAVSNSLIIAVSSSVTRMGSVTGTREPMRIISTCSIRRSDERIYSSRSSDSVSGSRWSARWPPIRRSCCWMSR